MSNEPMRPEGPDDRKGWQLYWVALGMSWRREPEIDAERQQFLRERQTTVLDTSTRSYPFGGIKLSRADVEWLIATPEDGAGPIMWEEERKYLEYDRRQGLDVRGSDMRDEDLGGLPLALLRAGNDGRYTHSQEEIEQAAARLDGAKLDGAHLEGAKLAGVHLKKSQLRGAFLAQAGLEGAHLEGAELWHAHLEHANLQGVDLSDADLWGASLKNANLHGANLERAELGEANFEGAHLMDANLKGAVLNRNLERYPETRYGFKGWTPPIPGGANLERAFLPGANLDGADIRGVHLEGAFLYRASLRWARLEEAHLERAVLYGVDLQSSCLGQAHLEGADLTTAHLEGADFTRAHLEGADLSECSLEGAICRRAYFDGKSNLGKVVFGHARSRWERMRHRPQARSAILGDVHWGGVDLTQVPWEAIECLGDEQEARGEIDKQGKPKARTIRHGEFEDAARACTQLATALRGQGLNQQADRFAFRAQLLNRRSLRLRRRYLRAFGSWILDIIAGYGYRPLRSIVAYILIICLFAGAYLLNAQFAAPHLSWDEALVLSISSFHGRGFFTSGISLGDTLARLAAGEAIIGLLIEITFIATFTQRFFGR